VLQALAELDALVAAGHAPAQPTLRAVVAAALRSGYPSRAAQAFSRACAAGCKPDSDVTTELVQALGSASMPERAVELVAGMKRQQGRALPECVYTGLMEVCVATGHPDLALSALSAALVHAKEAQEAQQAQEGTSCPLSETAVRHLLLRSEEALLVSPPPVMLAAPPRLRKPFADSVPHSHSARARTRLVMQYASRVHVITCVQCGACNIAGRAIDAMWCSQDYSGVTFHALRGRLKEFMEHLEVCIGVRQASR
jgi:hypothetical protein